MRKNVFVLGLTDFQRAELETLRHADQCAFHDLVGHDALRGTDHVVFGELLDRARVELESFDGSVDAIIAHWDFPTSVLAPILCREWRIPAPTLESVLECEHKYWSRLEQEASVPDQVPAFVSFDPFADDPLDEVDLDFPFWVKPVKSHSSHLGFRIDDAHRYAEALEEIRAEIHDVGDAFDEVLAMADLPPQIRREPGTSCLAEQLMTGVQLAVEGSMFRGRFDVHGIFDMHKDERGESITSIEYPAALAPESVQATMVEVAERCLRHIGFDDGCFNVEYLWDGRGDELKIIEINTRISQSHSELFVMVDGRSNHEIAVDIALGVEPRLPEAKGDYAVAAKSIVLRRDDGIVTRVPTEDEIAALVERFPGTEVRLKVAVGDRLDDLRHQDAYNYELGEIYLGANDREELAHRRSESLRALRFEFDPVPGDEGVDLSARAGRGARGRSRGRGSSGARQGPR